VLITDHNVREVLDICDYSYVLHSGEIIAEGDSDKIIGNKDARKLYLGDTFKV
jgi:lipopolysaccharide export system ATP-binding protein